MRAGGIYGPGRSALDDVRAGTARRVVKPGHAFSRIHRDDIALAACAAMAQDVPPGVRVLHLVDDEPAPSAAVVEEAARLLGAPPPAEIPFEDARQRMSPMALSFWAENRRVANARTKRRSASPGATRAIARGYARILAARARGVTAAPAPDSPSGEVPSVASLWTRALRWGPLRQLNRRTLPPLLVYLVAGASGFTAVAETFWVRERLGLSASALLALAAWLTVPWTLKMVFGHLVDTVPLLGSRRRIYILVGALLQVAALLALSAAAAGWAGDASAEAVYVAASLLAVVGLVLQDCVADALTTEVVDRSDADGTPRDPAAVQAELGDVQVLGRVAVMGGAFAVAGIGGVAAQFLPVATVFLLGAAVPLLSILAALLLREAPDKERERPDARILGGGAVFAAALLALAVGDVPFAPEIGLLLSLGVITWLLLRTMEGIPAETQRAMAAAAAVIFAFRAAPSPGPALQWWQIDVLGYDQAFFGVLAQIGTGLAILGSLLLGSLIVRLPLGRVLGALAVLGALFSLPTIGMLFGLHHWTEAHLGFGARTLGLVDTVLSAPLAQLGMIPMLTLIAVHAPPGRQATWFALVASLMNLALQAGAIVSRGLNAAFPVARGDYAALPALTIAATVLGLAVALGAIAMLGRKIRPGTAPAAEAPSAPR
jgi:MFS family permease